MPVTARRRTVEDMHMHPEIHRELARQRQAALIAAAAPRRARSGEPSWRRRIRLLSAWRRAPLVQPDLNHEQGEMQWTCT